MAYWFYEDIKLVGWFIDRIRAPYSAHIRIITWDVVDGSGGGVGGRYVVYSTCFVPWRIEQKLIHMT